MERNKSKRFISITMIATCTVDGKNNSVPTDTSDNSIDISCK